MTESVDALLRDIRKKNTEKRRARILSDIRASPEAKGKNGGLAGATNSRGAALGPVSKKNKLRDLEEIALRIEGQK